MLLAADRLRAKGDFQSEPSVASGRRPRRSLRAKTYARASTWVRRRASAADVAAARLLPLIMVSSPRPETVARGDGEQGPASRVSVHTHTCNGRFIASDSMAPSDSMEPPVMPLLNLSQALGLQPQPPAQLSPRALISSPRSPRSTSASPRGSQSPSVPWVSCEEQVASSNASTCR